MMPQRPLRTKAKTPPYAEGRMGHYVRQRERFFLFESDNEAFASVAQMNESQNESYTGSEARWGNNLRWDKGIFDSLQTDADATIHG
jgi:hypothetical protein